MYFVQPSDRERYALRLVLIYHKGATSFKDLLTNNDLTFSSFQSLAMHMGLIESDVEWRKTLDEASSFITNIQHLREIFVSILFQSLPSDPGKLWDSYKDILSEDILYKHLKNNNRNEINMQPIYDEALHNINLLLRKQGKLISDFLGMPSYNCSFEQLNQLAQSNLNRIELSYNKEDLSNFFKENFKLLNEDQLRAYNKILNSLDKNNESNYI